MEFPHQLTILGFGQTEVLLNPLKRLCLANALGSFTITCIQVRPGLLRLPLSGDQF